MSAFIGLDLAWTAHRDYVPFESGLCVLEGERANDIRCVRLEADRLHITTLADTVSDIAEGSVPAVVAIDAPLIVTEHRTAEHLLNRVFGRYKAGAYLASLNWLARKDFWAGPRMARELEDRGFALDPEVLLGETSEERIAFEVYPHAMHVGLFGLEERIPYKKGRVESRRTGLRSYQTYLRQLCQKSAPALLNSDRVSEVLNPEVLEGLPGQSKAGPSLKHYEDILDGLTCALVAWLAWRNPAEWHVYGDAEAGYIVAPPSPRP